MRLLLDCVPNHVSIDSLWTLESNLFVEGTLEDLMSRPYDYASHYHQQNSGCYASPAP